MIIGTAGHIDHGKTALVKALTGVDADRLPEEKARGITLDLGFAYASGAGGGTLGFVDVPGHENLIHTMLAGAAGIDFVVLVVAADDGPMPQTLEHLQIIDLLGLSSGAIVINKIDRVDTARVDAVAAQMRALTANTALADAPIFPLSALEGRGVDELRAHLTNAARRARAQRALARFRLAIDRAFTLPGAGVIVTGTVYAGSAALGDELLLSPRGVSVRVRSIHARNRAAERAQAGERCGINIVAPQLNKDNIERGQWLLAPALHLPTQRIDARVRLLAHARGLPHWANVHVHLAAAHTLAHIVPLEADSLDPGASALVQLVLDKPICAINGDRLVLRDAAARRTIGGGTVLDLAPPARKRKTPQRLAQLRSLEHTDARERLRQSAAFAALGVDVQRFCLAWNIEAAGLKPLPEDLQSICAGAHVFTRTDWAVLKQRVAQLLNDLHAQQPDELGIDATRLRRMLGAQLTPPVCNALIDELIAERTLGKTGPWLHLPEHSTELPPAERELAQRALRLIEGNAFDPPWVRELAHALGEEESRARLLMLRLARRAEVFQITRDLFYSRAGIAQLARIARDLEQRDGSVRAAQFRDSIQIGRKRAIQILEFFDRIGYTRRAGDAHRVRSDNLLNLADTL